MFLNQYRWLIPALCFDKMQISKKLSFSFLLWLTVLVAGAEVRVENFTCENPQSGSLLIEFDTDTLQSNVRSKATNQIFSRYTARNNGSFEAVTVTYLCIGSSAYVRNKSSSLGASYNDEFGIGYQTSTKSVDDRPFYVGAATFSLDGKVYNVTVGNTDRKQAAKVQTVAFRMARSIQKLN